MVRVKSLEANQGQRGAGRGPTAAGWLGAGAEDPFLRGAPWLSGQRHAQGSGGQGSHPWLQLLLVSERVSLGEGASGLGSRCGLPRPFFVPASPGEGPLLA